MRPVPIERAVDPGIVGGARIGHHVRGREGDAIEGALGLVGIGARLRQHERLELAGVGRQVDLQAGEDWWRSLLMLLSVIPEFRVSISGTGGSEPVIRQLSARG